MDKNNLEGKILFNKYQIIKIIGQGAFGTIYLGKEITNNNEQIAIKIVSIISV